MMKGSKGTKMPRGDKRQTLSFKIPLINFSEQQKIASVLSALDAKIELNNRINAELEAMAKTLYDYWFVQFDFPDADGRPYKSSGGRMVWNEGLKREVPEGWEVKPLSYHLNCNMNTIKYTDHYRTIHYLDTSSLNKNIISHLQSLDCNVDIIPSRAQRVVVNNDILFSTVRPNLRHYGIIKKPSKNLIASTGFAILSHKDDSAYNDFFFMFITSEPNLKKLDAIASSSVSSYPSINYSDILNLQIPLPRESNFLKDLSEKISAPLNIVSFKQSENQTLTELRDWLLPMLMNGQVKVVR
jgi:type I restriction enzyme S subunit